MTAAYEYTVFNRRLHSELRLPALRTPADNTRAVGPPIHVERGTLPVGPDGVSRPISQVYEDPEGAFAIYQTPDRETCYWFYDGVGRLRIRDGAAVTLSRAPAGSDAAVRRLVRGPAVRSALIQQGAVVIHASAVVVDGQVIAFAGPSGRGKSTTASAFVADGYELLTDDVLPVTPRPGDSRPMVPPGYPRLSIDNRVAATLGFDHATGGADGVAVEERFTGRSHPISTVYLLTDGSQVATTPLSTQAAIFGLLRASYPLYDAANATAHQRHLDACGRLARTVDVCRLTRPRSLDRLDELVGAVKKRE